MIYKVPSKWKLSGSKGFRVEEVSRLSDRTVYQLKVSLPTQVPGLCATYLVTCQDPIREESGPGFTSLHTGGHPWE